MKLSFLLFCLLLPLSPALAQGHPISPGIRQADQAEDQTQKNIPPPTMQRSHTDYVKVEQEADELSKIAQSIPSDVQQMAKGMLPKDVIEKLKHIEKLSKHLRGELGP